LAAASANIASRSVELLALRRPIERDGQPSRARLELLLRRKCNPDGM
jgi:hypothetical protein